MSLGRKALEQCAWEKTPRKDRRTSIQRQYSKGAVTERLKGNAREVRVFDPSGSTDASMNPWWPLWALYNDELKQRCEQEKEPRIRPPYLRSRPDYVSNVEKDLSGRTRRG